ncbi:MAG: alpha-mannosidase, partial [Defluviitaleaceae bacterium]|nr:alpha-mannosidase [Defluviitaleaceae bacterium]
LDDFNAVEETAPISCGGKWGGYDRTAWFKPEITIPEGFSQPGTKPAFTLKVIKSKNWDITNIECLLYVNGKATQGLDMWHTEAFLSESQLEEGKLDIALKAWAGLSDESNIRTLGETALVSIHTATDEFYFAATALAESIELLDVNDLRRVKLTKLLRETFNKINFQNSCSEEYYNSIESALAFLNEGLESLRRPEIKPTVNAVGHSHIDMAWLWRLSATREKASRTFSTVLNLMEQFPDYYYMHSSPQLYKFLSEDYPEIFERVVEKIKSGQWEATGGMWVESDTNIPSGESLVRQFLYGKRYFKDVLGVDTKVLWLPDVFGYSAALPQIAKKAGYDYFMTTKISWNQYNHFPYDTFNWRGLDGTEILTHFITTPSEHWFYTYNGAMTPFEVPGIWINYKQKNINDQLLLAYGYGDGGGGPTREMLMTRKAMEDMPGLPYVKTNKAEPYFETLAKNVESEPLETWDGELYFEYHRGTYTSQAYVKKANRQMENLLHDAEFVSMLRDLKLGKSEYPAEALTEMWERVLLLQFHDIIPGTSIRQVYEDCREDYEKMLSKADGLINTAASALNEEIKLNQDSVVVYNNLSWRRDTAELFLPFSEKITESTTFTDSDGYILESQQTEGGLYVIFTELPPLGYKTYALGTASAPQADDFFKLETEETKTTLETNFYEIEFNEKGEITRLYDKLAKRQVAKGPLNALEAYEDKPLKYDSWDIDIFYKEKPYTNFEYSGIEVVEQGNLMTTLRRKIKFNKSEIEQDIVFYTRNRRIDFETRVNWNERQTLLKAAFPLDIRAVNATYDTQFGFIERPNHSNNERDFAQFEVCGHKWADLSESGFGVALFNDCKYGYDCKDSVMRLTLLKGPTYPDKTADIGEHVFTYALYPHFGSLTGSYVQTRAAEFNSPVLGYELPKTSGSNFAEVSLLRVNAMSPQQSEEGPSLHVIVDTIKKAEDGSGLILRVYECNNRTLNEAVIQLDSCVRFTEVVETNLVEEPLEEQVITVDGQNIIFDIKPFEIKTFKLSF